MKTTIQCNEDLAKTLKRLAQVQLAQSDLARYNTQIAALKQELSNHRFNLVLRKYLSRQIRILQEKSKQKQRFVQDGIAQYHDTYSKIPNDIWESTRKFDFFVDDIVMGRTLTLEDAIDHARIRKETDPFWYTFGE